MLGILTAMRVLLVVDPGAPSDWQPEARRALRADGDVTLVEPDAEAVERARAREREALEAAHSCASAVRARYTLNELAEMAADALRCEEDHALALSTPEGRPVLVDLLVSRGLAALGQGEADAARAVFARAVATDPRAHLDPNLYPPTATVAFAEARSAVESAPRAEALLRTTPAGALVTVDGVHLGPSPTTAFLLPTEHLVRAELPGHRPAVARVELLGMGTAFTLEPLAGEEALDHASLWLMGGVGTGDAPVLRAAGEALGVDAVLLVARDTAQGRPMATLFRIPSGSETRIAARNEALAEVITRVLHPPPVSPPSGGGSDGEDGDDLGILGAWWFWTAAGAFAVGTIGLAIYPSLQPESRTVHRRSLVFELPEEMR